MCDEFDFFETHYENDLQELSDNEAWEDAQADMGEYKEEWMRSEGGDEVPDCDCGRDWRQEQYDFYGIYAGKMCDECFRERYKQGPYFDAGYAGESLEPDY